MSYTVRDLRQTDPRDIERLCDMFNDFDSAWPGGFMRGIPATVERVREMLSRSRRLAVCVVETDDDLVGYCDLDAQEGQKELAYIPLLGAKLSHHGRGVGKMLLREMIRRVTDLGYRELTLETWAGNTKAVPLYKKTGFHWAPETDVFMRNFIPSILAQPACRAYLDGTDWYERHEREIRVAPDDVKWRGMKVYPYRFRTDEGYLDVMIDEVSGRMTAIETPEYSLACSVPVEETPSGETLPIEWEIRSKNGKALDVALMVEGEPDIEVDARGNWKVVDGVTFTREVTIDPGTRPRHRGEAAHRIRSTFIVDGRIIRLETGLKVVYAVEIEYHGQGLFTDRTEMVSVGLRNRLGRDLAGRLSFDSHPSLDFDPALNQFTLPARSWTRCDVRITAREPGAFQTRLRLEAGSACRTAPIAFRVFRTGDARATIDVEETEQGILESPSIRAIANLRGGNVVFQRGGDRDRSVFDLSVAELGPPFKEHRMRPELSEGRIEETDRGTALVLSAASKEQPGLVVERWITLLEGGLARVDHRVLNTTGEAVSTSLRVGGWPHLDGVATLPAPQGLLREPMQGWGEFPDFSETDFLAFGSKFVESWVAVEGEGRVVGMIWEAGSSEEYIMSVVPSLVHRLDHIPAAGGVWTPTLYLLATTGDWRVVREWWRRFIGPSDLREETLPETHRLLELATVPSPAFLPGEGGEVRLELQNRRHASWSGTIFASDEDALIQPIELRAHNVNRDRPFATSFRVRPSNRPEVRRIHATLDNGLTVEPFPLTLIRTCSVDPVEVISMGDDRIDIHNGWLRFRVAPPFAGSMISLECGGVNHLASSYPESRPFVWTNPWHGGIHPFIGDWCGDPRLSRERFRGEPIEMAGAGGTLWTGVRVICEPEHKDLRWLRMETDYLTASGSHLVSVSIRWINKTEARMATPARGGIGAWLQVGGDRSKAILHWVKEGVERKRRRGGFEIGAASKEWAAVHNAESGDWVSLIDTRPDPAVTGYDFMEEGAHLSASGLISLDPGETKEYRVWVAVGDRSGDPASHASLARMKRLP